MIDYVTLAFVLGNTLLNNPVAGEFHIHLVIHQHKILNFYLTFQLHQQLNKQIFTAHHT